MVGSGIGSVVKLEIYSYVNRQQFCIYLIKYRFWFKSKDQMMNVFWMVEKIMFT